jgi:hypothetical protein
MGGGNVSGTEGRSSAASERAEYGRRGRRHRIRRSRSARLLRLRCTLRKSYLRGPARISKGFLYAASIMTLVRRIARHSRIPGRLFGIDYGSGESRSLSPSRQWRCRQIMVSSCEKIGLLYGRRERTLDTVHTGLKCGETQRFLEVGQRPRVGTHGFVVGGASPPRIHGDFGTVDTFVQCC